MCLFFSGVVVFGFLLTHIDLYPSPFSFLIPPHVRTLLHKSSMDSDQIRSLEYALKDDLSLIRRALTSWDIRSQRSRFTRLLCNPIFPGP